MLFVPACTVGGKKKKKNGAGYAVSSCRLSPAMQRQSCGAATAHVAAGFFSTTVPWRSGRLWERGLLGGVDELCWN